MHNPPAPDSKGQERAGHTPDLTVCDPGDYGDYDGECVVILGDDDTRRVGLVLGTDEQALADAALWAASPDLLASLRQAAEALEPFARLQQPPTGFTNCSDVRRDEWFKAGELRAARSALASAQAAISRAEGGAA
jgi:hypothetical protein